jgi:hypothetical protein
MDAQELKPGSSRGVRPQVVRLVIAWLSVVLASGLWQAYGAWLLENVARHAF